MAARGKTGKSALKRIEAHQAANSASGVMAAVVPLAADVQVFVGLPTASTWIDYHIYKAVTPYRSRVLEKTLEAQGFVYCCSALTDGFNQLWYAAINHRESLGITHFAMVHSDIRLHDPHWLATLYKILVSRDLDMVSCIVPIKSQHGATSTAMDTHPWTPRRLMMAELDGLPLTFDTREVAAGKLAEWGLEGPTGPLLCNTGCWLARIDRAWATDVCFEVRNKIVRNAAGQYLSLFEPEDWRFGRDLNRWGVPWGVTREVSLGHMAWTEYPNRPAAPWGEPRDSNAAMAGLPIEGSDQKPILQLHREGAGIVQGAPATPAPSEGAA